MMRCTRRTRDSDLVAAACPDCGHSSLVHPGRPTGAMDACIVCDMLIAAEGHLTTKPVVPGITDRMSEKELLVCPICYGTTFVFELEVFGLNQPSVMRPMCATRQHGMSITRRHLPHAAWSDMHPSENGDPMWCSKLSQPPATVEA